MTKTPKPTKKIMMVDDEYNNRFLVRRMFTRVGYEVDDFEHGDEAHERLVELKCQEDTRHYDLILSDIDMGYNRMDGLALAENAARLAPETPFFLMTGRPRKTIPSNVKHQIEKPFNRDDLYNVLEKYSSFTRD